jgi:glucose-1-phosphate cytidylyltransferase
MKVVILAGGLGTRLSEETDLKPKPMVEIGGKPILWHIMKIYSHYGFNDFIVCAGYKSYIIKDFFHHYYMHSSDVAIDLVNNNIQYLDSKAEPWKITLVDTGLGTMTGGRLARVRKYLDNETFMFTYGDGVSDVDLSKLVDFHKKNKQLATLTAVPTSSRFGSLVVDDESIIRSFEEKPKDDGTWINGGFFVLEPGVFDYIKGGDATVWERDPLENIAREGKLNAYKHRGFWKPMDTLRDKIELEGMWDSGKAPWKKWS